MFRNTHLRTLTLALAGLFSAMLLTGCQDPYVKRMQIRAFPTELTADEASVTVWIDAVAQTNKKSTEGLVVELALEGYGLEIAPLSVTLDGAGQGEATFDGLTLVGAGQIVATAREAGESGAQAMAREFFSIRPGAPASFTFEIDPAAAPFAAGDVIPFAYEVLDAHGNVSDAPVIVTIGAPNVAISNDGQGSGEILGITRSGTYLVNARVAGSALEDSETVVVDPNPGEGFNLVLSANLVQQDSRAMAFVYDAFGNAIPLSGVEVAVDGAIVTPGGTTGREIVFPDPGTFTVTATLLADPTLADSELITVQPIADLLPPSVTLRVVWPSASTIVDQRGHIEVAVTVEDQKSLAEGRVMAQFGADIGCTATSPLLVLAGQGTPTAGGSLQTTLNTSVRAPGCAFPSDVVTLVAKASDQAGNTGFSATDTSLTIYAPPNFDPAAPGYEAMVWAYGDRIENGNLGNDTLDVAIDTLEGAAYLTQSGNDQILVAYPDRTQVRLEDNQRNRYAFDGQPEGVALSAAGYLYVSDPTGNRSIWRIDPDRDPNNPRLLNNLFGPGRLNLESAGPRELLCFTRETTQDDGACYAIDANGDLTRDFGVQNGAGSFAQAMDVWHGTDAVSVVWMITRGCDLYRWDLDYGALPPTNETLVVSGVGGGNRCEDLVALPTGAVAVAVGDQGTVVRVNDAGTETVMAENLPDVTGVDFGGGSLWVLDPTNRALYRIDATTGSF
ncbi:MAG: hypothetical protein P1V51_19090 [Deltaproteobacteria bacterium]|nr:hypothetical protein [Deltaproteobacteria bacterium]